MAIVSEQEPVAVVVGTVPPVERSDKPLGAPEVSPAVQAAFAAGRLQGRREGFLEAVAIMRAAADGLAKEGGPILATVADGLRHVARQIETSVNKAGGK